MLCVTGIVVTYTTNSYLVYLHPRSEWISFYLFFYLESQSEYDNECVYV